MGVIDKQAARVVLANFLADVRWSGPWKSLPDGHCGIYAEHECYEMPLDEMMRVRRWISRWIRKNLDHSVHRWSDRMSQLEPLDVYPRRKLMRRTARDLVQKRLLDEDQPVPQNAWIGAVSLQALAYKRGQPLVILSEREHPSANSVFSQHFMVIVYWPDGRDMLYDAGDDTEVTVRNVLANSPQARMLLRSINHYDYFAALSGIATSSSDGVDSSSDSELSLTTDEEEFLGPYVERAVRLQQELFQGAPQSGERGGQAGRRRQDHGRDGATRRHHRRGGRGLCGAVRGGAP